MLAHPGMVGRALEGEVERDLEPVRGRAARPAGRSRRTCRGRDGSPCGRPPRRRSPTGSRRRRPGRQGRCSGPCGRRGRSDGSAAGTGRRSPSTRRRGGAPRRRRRCRGGPPCRLHERGNSSYQVEKRARSRSTVTASGAGSSTANSRSAARRIRAASGAPSACWSSASSSRLERGAIRAFGSCGGGLHEALADLEVDRHVLAGVETFREIAAPRSEAVDPRVHGVVVATEAGDPELALEHVVAACRHRLLEPGRLLLVPVEDGAGDHVVAVRERVRVHAHQLADRALDREAAPVHHRRDRLDDHAVAATGYRGFDGRRRPRRSPAAGMWQRWHGGHSARVSKRTQRCRKYDARG